MRRATAMLVTAALLFSVSHVALLSHLALAHDHAADVTSAPHDPAPTPWQEHESGCDGWAMLTSWVSDVPTPAAVDLISPEPRLVTPGLPQRAVHLSSLDATPARGPPHLSVLPHRA